MTGKELIIYILENNLENVEIFDDNLNFIFMSIEEAAVQFECGPSTIVTLIKLGRLNGTINDDLYNELISDLKRIPSLVKEIIEEKLSLFFFVIVQKLRLTTS